MLKIDMPEETVAREEVDPAEVALVTEIFRSLTKTIKTFNVYPKDNPIYLKFAEELSQKFDAFFATNEDLLLEVEQFSLHYKGKEVFSSSEKSDNIAFSLYLDGIREICFHRGLTIEEITEFIDILRIAPKEENLEDDIVTLLWERDLEHLSYFVPEEVGETELFDEENLQFETTEEAGPVSGGSLPSALTAGPAKFAFVTGPFTESEIGSVQREADALGRESLLSSAADLFFELMTKERDISAFGGLARNIRKVIDFKAEEKDIETVVGILTRLRAFSESLDVPEMRDIVEAVIVGAGSVENIRLMVRVAQDPDALSGYLHVLGEGAIPNMVEVLGELEDRKMRRLLCTVLASLAPRRLDLFEGGSKDARWFLVRNIAMILGMTKDERAVKLLREIVGHAEPRVRREVIRALDNISSPETREILAPALDDRDQTARISAVRALKRIGGKEVFSLFKSYAARDDFKERAFPEKKEFLDAFGEVGKEEAFPILSDFFRRKGLFKRDESLELRACAAYGLGRVGTPEAIALLESEADSKKEILRDACKAALAEARKK